MQAGIFWNANFQNLLVDNCPYVVLQENFFPEHGVAIGYPIMIYSVVMRYVG